MITVNKHGGRRRILNPVTGTYQEVITVQFVEPSRSGGANSSLSGSSDALSQAAGTEVGLQQLRTHTQPVRADKIGEFPIGREFPSLFINRTLYSTPQMAQQEGVDARMVDGQPTYFVTSISDREEVDTDKRLEASVVAAIDINLFKNARVSVTDVQMVEDTVSVPA